MLVFWFSGFLVSRLLDFRSLVRKSYVFLQEICTIASPRRLLLLIKYVLKLSFLIFRCCLALGCLLYSVLSLFWVRRLCRFLQENIWFPHKWHKNKKPRNQKTKKLKIIIEFGIIILFRSLVSACLFLVFCCFCFRLLDLMSLVRKS